MTLTDVYLLEQQNYEKKYGTNTIVLMQVGSFYECYGVDTPDRAELIAAKNNIDQIRKIINADSLAFISIEGLYKAMGSEFINDITSDYCDACFTGNYSIVLTDIIGGDTSKQLSLLNETNKK